MTERQRRILYAIIEEYIRTASPVGSRRLGEAFDFGIKPAMIRNEMAELEEAGHVEQPHTSAGRIPTDTAYRHYIADILSSAPRLRAHEQRRVQELFATLRAQEELFRAVSLATSQLARSFSAAGRFGDAALFTHGLGELSREPELQEPETITGLLEFFDALPEVSDELMRELWMHRENGRVTVRVGSENTHKEIRHCTLIAGRYRLPQGGDGFVLVLGPRRMNYRKSVATVRYISSLIEEL